MNLRLVRNVLVLAMALTLVGENAFAQQRGGGTGRGGFGGFGGFGGITGRTTGSSGVDKLRLLGAKQVQEELALSEEQIVGIKEGTDSFNEETRDMRNSRFDFSAFQALRELPEEERQEKMAKLQEDAKKKREESEAKVDKIRRQTLVLLEATMDASQIERLSQIHIQTMGIRALLEKDVIKKLQLTDDQVAKIKKIMEDSAKKQGEAMQKMMQEFRNQRGGQGGGRGQGGRGQGGGRGRGGEGNSGRPERPSGDDGDNKTTSVSFLQQERGQGGGRQGGRGQGGGNAGGRGQRGQGGGGQRGGNSEFMEKFQKAREEATKKMEKDVMAVLTDAQKKKFEELKGEKFELDMRAMFTRNRGGGNRGGNTGGRGNRGGDAGGGRGNRGGDAGGGRGNRGGDSGRPQRPKEDDK